MVKKIIIFSVVAIILVVIIQFFSQVGKLIKSFNKLNEIEVIDTAYTLRHKSFKAFNITTSKVDTIDLNNRKIINFWASWCQPCLNEMASLHKIPDSLKDVSVILITFDSLVKNELLAKHQISLPAYYLTDTSLFVVPPVIPKTLIMNKDTVLNEIYGETNWMDSSILNELRNFYK